MTMRIVFCGVGALAAIVLGLFFVAVGMLASLGVRTRLGPSAPRCNQIDAEPGPPLNAKHSGRVLESAPLSE